MRDQLWEIQGLPHGAIVFVPSVFATALPMVKVAFFFKLAIVPPASIRAVKLALLIATFPDQ
jgi:hypothetical protein